MCSFNQHFTLLLIRNDSQSADGRVKPDVKGFAPGFQTFPVDELVEASGPYCRRRR